MYAYLNTGCWFASNKILQVVSTDKKFSGA